MWLSRDRDISIYGPPIALDEDRAKQVLLQNFGSFSFFPRWTGESVYVRLCLRAAWAAEPAFLYHRSREETAIRFFKGHSG